ncbi:MAG: sulfatase [Planctomycetota bacterium]
MAENESPMNVVVILSDDQAWSDYSFMGHPHIETPHLDQLARESLTFTRGYSPVSLCRPSLATIISGLYPHQHGIVGNDPPWEGMETGERRPPHNQPDYVVQRTAYLRHVDAMKSMPQLLAARGYRSLQTGKWWEGAPSRAGFTDAMSHGDFTRDGRHGDRGLTIGRQGLDTIDSFFAETTKRSEPFYLWYAPFLPHAPHNPPKRLLDKYRSKTDSLPMAKYWAMCEWFDETCGELMSLLEKYSLAENTLVVYVTDNGWINRLDASRYAPRSKRSPNEGGTRTPIMYRLPGVIKPRMDHDHLASTVDVVPTTLSLLNMSVPEELPGIDVLDEEALQSRESIFGEIFEHDIQSLDDPAVSLQYRWIIDGRYKLIDPSSRMSGAEQELYDLLDDPTEQHDLSGTNADQVDVLLKKLDAWWDPPTA